MAPTKPPADYDPKIASENVFLVECMKHYDQEKSKIDLSLVAQAMGFKNVGSAKNKWNALKKKHGIKLDAFMGAGGTPNSKRKGSPKMSPAKTKVKVSTDSEAEEKAKVDTDSEVEKAPLETESESEDKVTKKEEEEEA